MGYVYDQIKDYKKKYSGGLGFRLKKHANVIEKHLNPEEKSVFAFYGQKHINGAFAFPSSCVISVTNKRILIGKKRLLWGYYLTIITPDLYNDMQIYQGLLWGKVTIDTVKEETVIGCVSKGALDEIETRVSEFMMEEKKKYQESEK